MSPEPPVLDYRSRQPKALSPKPVLELFSFMSASVLGFGLFCILGVATIYRVGSMGFLRPLGVSFVILGIAVLIYGVITKSRRRFFFGGLLVGCGLAMAMYGAILFMASYAGLPS